LEDEDWEIDEKIRTFSENDADREVAPKGGLRRHGGYVSGKEFKVVLMRKKREYFIEDDEEKMARLENHEKAMKTKKPGSRDDGFYGDNDVVFDYETP
jgi:hypothetical protein